jgi:hypothetical protein
MADDSDARFERHEEILGGLARMLAAQHVMNERQLEFNQEVKLTLARVDITLAKIETLLTRVFRHESNGRET